MTPDQFVTDAIRTEAKIPSVKLNVDSFNNIKTSLVSLGEILDQFKKNVFYDKPFRPIDIYENLHTVSHNTNDLHRKTFRTWFGADAVQGQKTEVQVNPRLFHAIVGIITEAVELLQALSIDGTEMDVVNLREEFGDLLWYIAIGVDETGGNLEGVMETVIAKLRARYPDKFNSEAAINRNLIVERKILEGDSNPITIPPLTVPVSINANP